MTENTEPGQEPETGAAPIAALDDVLQAAPAAPEPKAKEPKTEAAPEAKPENKQTEPFWYRKSLKEKEDRNKALERELQEHRERSAQPAQQANVDPQAALEARVFQAEVNMSERFARREHGAELVEETRDWLKERTDMERWALGQPDPWEAAVGAYKREKLAAEIGDNPEKWRESERERIRAELAAEMEQSGYASQSMTTQPRLPTAAAGARSAGPKGGFTGPPPLTSIAGQRR